MLAQISERVTSKKACIPELQCSFSSHRLACRRNTLDHEKLREIGFIVYALGKPLDPFIVKAYS